MRYLPPHGPTVHDEGTATFRVWAPHATRVELLLDGRTEELTAQERGWFCATTAAQPGSRYAFSLDGGPARPDPASRRQPDGVHAASELVAPPVPSPQEAAGRWQPPPLAGAVFYELHVGTFTPAGTLDGAIDRLGHLADLGVTHVELMPVAAFNGDRGWGYDGVAWYAVHEAYGGPAALTRFVEACHAHGLAVVLDVVYNHFGPSGNYLPEFGPYLTDRHVTPWGDAVNLDGPGSDGVRSFIIGNALHWLGTVGIDGLRLDAVHSLVDASAVHLLAALADAVEDLGHRQGRTFLLIAESDRQDPQTIQPRALGGLGLDGQWHDELHHAIHVALTGEQSGYYADYRGLPDLAACWTRGFVFDGRYSPARDRSVGAPLGDISSHRLLACLQNHDQVGNRPAGDRLSTIVGADLLRIGVLLLLTSPDTPLLFMGEEIGETRPFPYVTSHPEPDLAEAVREGRRAEFQAFAELADTVPDPQDPATFASAVLDWEPLDHTRAQATLALYRDLLALRRSEPALGTGRRHATEIREVTRERFAALRSHPAGHTCAVLCNLADTPATFDLPDASVWEVACHTRDTRYGGDGATVDGDAGQITVAARAACVLRAGGGRS